MKDKVLAHVLRVNRMLKARHLCLDCEEGWWLGLGIDSKWDWMTMVREPMSKFTRPYRIEDAPGYVPPRDLWPVVPVTADGAEATCPRCKTVNKCSFGADGRMEWWADPKKGHCVHFRGMYSTGDFRDVQASFS